MRVIKSGARIALVIIALVFLVACAPAAPPVAPTPTPKPAPAAPTTSAQPAAATVTAAPKPTPPPTPTRVSERVKVQTTGKGSTWLPYYLGTEKGFFREEGLELELVDLSATLAVPAMLKGDIDYNSMVSRNFIGALTGMEVKSVMILDAKPNCWLYGGKGVNTVQDLKGKAVGVNSLGAACHYATSAALKALGVDPEKDIKWTVIAGPADLYAALKGGMIAGAALVAGYPSLAVKDGFKEVAWGGNYVDVPMAGLATTTRRLKENPDQVRRMIRAVLKSVYYQRDHPDEAVATLMKELNMDKETAKSVYEDELKAKAWDGKLSKSGAEAMLDMALKAGSIKEAAPVDKALSDTFDSGPLDQALKELGLPKR